MGIKIQPQYISGIKTDRLAKPKVMLQVYTLNTNTSIHSKTKSTNSKLNNSTTNNETQSKKTELYRIENGSMNQGKLDNIKKTKNKQLFKLKAVLQRLEKGAAGNKAYKIQG